MTDQKNFVNVEEERYELHEGSAYNFELARRQFLKFFGGGIALIVPASKIAAQQGESGKSGKPEVPDQIGAWIHIDEQGVVNVFTGKTEVGQNIRTSLAQAVSEELHVPVNDIKLVMADTDLTPFDMGTFGSLTTPLMSPQIRKAAAAMREVLIDLAAQRWNVNLNSVRIENGQIISTGTKDPLRLTELTKGQKLVQAIPENVTTATADQWVIMGTSVSKVDGRDFVTGKHKYTSDIKRPGMLYGVVVRPESFKSTLASADVSAAQSIPNVTVVRDLDFIGVAAPDMQTARRAADQVKAEWKAPQQPSNSELFDLLQKPATETSERRGRSRMEPMIQGSIEEGLKAASKKLEQTYTVAYIAHAPLEPRAAVAEWAEGKLTVWTGTQRPFGVRGELAEAFRMPEEKIRVIVPDTGSGYGGKHTGECAIEAARIARAAGKPVKLVWSREEEFTWAYFRPAGVIRVKSGVTNDGKISAWEFHNYNSGPSGIETKYDLPNQHIEFHSADSPLRQGSYRALAATANHFARESHIDELANSIGMDPLEFRLKNTTDERLKGVLKATAEEFGWSKQKPSANRGVGIACGFEKDGYVATCTEVEIQNAGTNRTVKILRVVEAFDSGAVVNPIHLKNQIEGAITMGFGGALFEEIQFANGKILNPQFSAYDVPRFSESTPIEVVLMDRKDIPSAGAGETPIVGIAPAIANAIFQATGTRFRSLPLVPNGL
ncbi:MAG TPA: molybdopterin cofactor-binding domain-containing protein [Acidobacteriota bacterium]|nr:molybdopterin cofactor-binding domain-containing protein [Acidobacteriota bacterium]